MTADGDLVPDTGRFDLETDVVVVGGGGCGLTAAIAAAKGGAEVLVLEKQGRPACNTARSGGMVPAAGSLLVVSDPLPARADAIVLLAGSPAARALETADLYARGMAPLVVLTRERVTTAASRVTNGCASTLPPKSSPANASSIG